MKYISTRNGLKEFNFTEVFIKGLSDDGGLFIPKTNPKLSEQELLKLSKLIYKDLANEIIFSTNGFSSLALGRVVVICSCFKRAFERFISNIFR